MYFSPPRVSHFQSRHTSTPFNSASDAYELHPDVALNDGPSTLQDPLNLSGRTLDAFEHVKRGHDTRGGEDGTSTDAAAPTNMNARAMSEDIKRVLQGLGTSDASAALDAGGGGKRAQAERQLAAAKADADQSGKDTSAAAAKDTSHLRKGPKQLTHVLDNVRFRPGSHTWNTDGSDAHDASAHEARPMHWSPYDRVGVVDADP